MQELKFPSGIQHLLCIGKDYFSLNESLPGSVFQDDNM